MQPLYRRTYTDPETFSRLVPRRTLFNGFDNAFPQVTGISLWQNRLGLPLAIREFEAESVCYLVCTRLGIDNASAEYLAGYVRKYESTPPISLDAVLKSGWLIERMGQEHLPPRKTQEQ